MSATHEEWVATIVRHNTRFISARGFNTLVFSSEDRTRLRPSDVPIIVDHLPEGVCYAVVRGRDLEGEEVFPAMVFGHGPLKTWLGWVQLIRGCAMHDLIYLNEETLVSSEDVRRQLETTYLVTLPLAHELLTEKLSDDELETARRMPPGSAREAWSRLLEDRDLQAYSLAVLDRDRPN